MMSVMKDSKKRFLQALNGQKTDRVPFWFMRQAGRYLPEYRELRAKKGGFLEMAFDPASACEITLQPIRRFGMDAAIIFSDILTIPYALGQDLKFEAGEGPKLGELHLSQLHFDENKLQPVYDALAKTSSQLKSENFNETALIGFAGAPWTVATYMVEGGSSRDFHKVKTLAYREPQVFTALIDMIVHATAQYLIRQIEAGAEVLQIFDSWSGVLDSEQFFHWSIAPTRKIVKMVHEKYPHVPIIGFPKGAGLNYLQYAEETGVTAVQIDPSVPTKWAQQNLQVKKPVQGNLDPLCLLAGGATMERHVKEILHDLRDGPFVFNLGHGIHKDTPIAHVEKMVEMIRV